MFSNSSESPPPACPSGASSPTGLDITARIGWLCADLAGRLPELHHVDPHAVAYSFSQSRKRSRFGLWASLTPMRFGGGALVEVRRGRRYTFQRLHDARGCEMLYIMTVYLPRFLNLSFREKLETIIHELWHISPEFNGDLRRHPGRCYVHSPSSQRYDAFVEELASRWLSLSPPQHVHDFLRLSFAELVRQYGGVYGTRIRHPKLVRVD